MIPKATEAGQKVDQSLDRDHAPVLAPVHEGDDHEAVDETISRVARHLDPLPDPRRKNAKKAKNDPDLELSPSDVKMKDANGDEDSFVHNFPVTIRSDLIVVD